MKKNKYEISLWEDVVVEGTYKEVNSRKNGKSYHFKTNGKYSLPIDNNLIELCENFPNNWFEDNKGEIKASSPIDEEKLYYYSTEDGFQNMLGKTINLYSSTTWYEMTTPQHYEEEKIAVIGSHSMTAQFRAQEPKLVENTNGTSTFTFKIFYTYIDNETGEKKDNPFLKLLVNERKVKVFWKNKWYNLIIKGIQEDSNNKSITFTCKDQYIHELSKTGFGLTFSNELMNNSGSISELGEKVLKGTDWTLIPGDVIRQTVEEPVYVLSDSQVKSFTAKSIKGDIIIPTGAEILVYYSIYQNKSTYFQFHYADKYQTESNSTLIINGESCWIEEAEWEGQSVKLNGATILTFPNSEDIRVSSIYRAKRYVKQQLQEFDSLTNTYCNVYKDEDGRKVYGYIGTRTDDATVVVNLLANNGSTGFTNQEGWAQAESLKQTPGWLPQPYELSPELSENNADDFLDGEVKSFLFFEHKSSNVTGKDNEVRYLNKGVSNNTQYLENGFSAGENYIFRYKAAQHDSNTGKVKVGIDGKPIMFSPSSRDEAPIVPRFGKYDKNNLTILPITSGGKDYYFSSRFKGVKDSYIPTKDKTPISGKIYYTKNEKSEYISFTGTSFDINTKYYEIEKWIEFKLTCNYSISKKDIYTTYFDFIFGVDRSCWLQEAQLFKETFGEDENGVEVRLEPNTINGTMIAQPEYRYYYVDETRGLTELKKEEDIGWVYVGLVDIGNFDSTNDENYPNGVPKLTPIYPDNDFEKIRSIEAKNSNRFNILQTLAETFECYPVFNIENDFETGKIIYENGLPKKSVKFKESIGEETGLTFVYGIDLKTISRTINSDQIVTKTIVLDNNNQYAKNGFCTIKRAADNQSKANYILNFDYYISHGLIDGERLNMDLYDTSLGSLGLYYNLSGLNSEYDRISELKGLKKTELEKLESQIKVYKGYLEAADEEIIKIITNIKTLTQLDTITLKKVKKWLKTNDMQEVKDYVYSWVNINNNSLQYGEILDSLERAATIVENEIKNYEKSLDNESEEEPGLLQQIEELEEKFYKKYSRFIQEGSWNSEEYIDDNLYYLDAKSVSYTSSRPQVQYNISVLRLSALDDFKGKIFKLGDIAAIEDTEFFGYVPSSNPKTPYKEKILISEITSNFDSPENDSLKIQNYKTQFEDLFQRITATTQSLQYASGEYQKAANVIESDGTIKPAILQNSIALNEGLAINYQNNAIIQDSTGITLTDKSNSNRKVKITSGGIIFTNDGSTWKTGIDADGIRSDYLTTGSINADKILIYSGTYPTFRWSSTGLDAYSFGDSGVNFSKFVRFDQYGLYGIQNVLTEEGAIWRPEWQLQKDKESGKDIQGLTPEDIIWDNASFGMTWKGFFMKNKDDKGWVEVSSENDIAVFKTITENEISKDTEKIKIGRLERKGDSYLYGLRISDDSGAVVMETNEDGQLWLKDKLRVETYNKGEVQIGKLDTGATGEHGGRVITALEKSDSTEELKNKFVVYEDGYLEANGVNIKGTINATGGKIGNVSIDDIEEVLGAKKLEIDSDGGTFFINNSPSQIVLTAKILTEETATNWKWYYLENENRIEITEYNNSQTCIVQASDISLGGVKIYEVEATIAGSPYIAQIVLNHMALDIEVDLDLYTLETSEQEILKFFKSTSEGLTFSPQNFGFIPKKRDVILRKEDGYNFKIFVDDQEVNAKYHHWYEYMPVDNWSESVPTYFINNNGEYEKLTTKPSEGQNLGQLYIISNKDKYVINIASFYNELVEEDNELKNKEYSILKVELQDASQKTIANFYYSITFGTSKDLASFSVHSTGIATAIQNTALEFNTDGLTIYNGGLKIIGKDPITKKENMLLYYQEPSNDTNDTSGGLIIKGSGTFTGNVYAHNGEFAGTIKSSSGEIAGLIMEERVVNENTQESNSYLYDESRNLIINGTTGRIETNNILIKSGAEIETYLQLGNGFIKNPNWGGNVDERIFISTEKEGKTTFSLNDSGLIHIGEIIINGESSLLKLGTGNSNNIILNGKDSAIYGNNWNITPEVASFNKINITNGIFETGKIQYVGGSIFFKSSALIKEWKTNNSFTLDSTINLKVNDWIKISNSNASNINSGEKDYDVLIINIEENLQEKVYFIDKEFDNNTNFNYDTITYLCSQNQTDDVLSNNILIGVNTNDALTEGLAPRAFSFIEITKENNQLVYSSPKLIIGDLSAVKQSEVNYYKKIQGYGLYGENVYLNGTLTTKVGNDSYAGVNTISGVGAIKFNNYEGSNDTSKIVFWAGAKMDSNNNESEAISNAPFQVTENGSIYASQGIFEGTLITKSIIEGSIIRAAKLYGWQVADDNGKIIRQEAALKIYNTDNNLGIEFRQEIDKIDRKTLSLNTNGFVAYDYSNNHSKNFIDFNLDENSIGVDGYFNNMYLDYLQVDNIKIDNHKITYLADDKTTEYGFLKFKVGESKQQGWSLGIYEEKEKEILYYDNTSKKTLNSIDFQVTENVIFGSENNGGMEYKKILDDQNKIIGYDLYIS